ncbi:hypothetical protein [Arthrobacter sp. A2-55]|uniref:hypothetical protein n=1 Tax=Arthrobacter sp. A2-55 TaxID=2897337 RepID=UPI0021CD65BA|nr:hypothetical protein [Arthrobacter sp. A2-55]MCU6480513.1 hypothetical protein [Arthrobacter sp. A2-55]
MSTWGIYLLGLATLPALAGVWVAVAAATSRRYAVECYNCGKILGREGKTWAILAGARWKIHYLRYWYRTRPTWTCTPSEDES